MDVQQILRTYGKQLRESKKLTEIARKASTYADAQEFATVSAEALYDVLGRFVDVFAMTCDEALAIFQGALKANYNVVSRICERVQSQINASAKVGLNALVPEFDAERARGLAMAITDASEVTADYVKGLIVNNSRSIVDETIRQNAEAQKNLGFETYIKREYDDVGLHDGKERCQWCLDRCGEWDDYQEALRAGAFERHPGCGCIITYQVGRTRTIGTNATNWRPF